jgi:hypothetical protein
MGETWAADLDYADELGVDHRDIARGAVVFVIRRGPAAWCRRRWVKALLIALGLLVAVGFIPLWLLIPAVALGLVFWLIASPAPEGSDPGREPRS